MGDEDPEIHETVQAWLESDRQILDSPLTHELTLHRGKEKLSVTASVILDTSATGGTSSFTKELSDKTVKEILEKVRADILNPHNPTPQLIEADRIEEELLKGMNEMVEHKIEKVISDDIDKAPLWLRPFKHKKRRNP